MRVRNLFSEYTPYSWELSTREIVSITGLPPSCIHRMDTNTSPFPPMGALAALSKEIRKLPLNEYPDTSYLELRRDLAKYTGADVDQLVVTNGADEGLDILAKLFLDPGNEVIIPTPTYSMYRIVSELAAARVVQLPRDAAFGIHPQSITDMISEKTRLIFLCNPNNPTGNSILPGHLESILESNQNVTVVLDEAYCEFSGKSSLKLVDKYDNLVLIRTFSKAFSMAGIRVGYIISSMSSTEKINLVRPPNSLGVVSLFMARRALGDLQSMRKNVKLITKERDRMSTILSEMCETFPSEANFILFRAGSKNAGKLHSRMMKKGFVLRNFSDDSGIEDCLRVTVSTPRANNLFLRTLSQELDI